MTSTKRYLSQKKNIQIFLSERKYEILYHKHTQHILHIMIAIQIQLYYCIIHLTTKLIITKYIHSQCHRQIQFLDTPVSL